MINEDYHSHIIFKISDSKNITFNLSYLFYCVLFVVFIGFNPLPDDVLYGVTDTQGTGTSLKRYSLLIILFIIVFDVISTRGYYLKNINIKFVSCLILLYLWMTLSVFWSEVPSVAAKRLIVSTLYVIFPAYFVIRLGTRKVLFLFAKFLCFAILVSFFAVLLSKNAVHGYAIFDNGLTGTWKGIFGHKIKAGFSAVTCMVLCVFYFNLDKRKLWVLFFILSSVFLIMSSAKSSMGIGLFLVLYTFAVNTMYRAGIKNSPIVMLVLGGLLLIFPALYFWNNIIDLFNDPAAFTGRVAIWTVLLEVINDNFVIGVGFASTFLLDYQTSSLLSDYTTGWVLLVSNAHSGYLDIFLSLGIIGFIISIFTLFLYPFYILSSSYSANSYNGTMLFIFLFILFGAFMEGGLLDGGYSSWFLLCIILFSITDKRSSNKC